MQLARTEALLADARGDRRTAQLRFKSADEQGQKWFETQWQFALTHTGSLFGVARAWRARQVLETELAATGASHAARARAGLQADLKRLEQLAARVTDLRGRQAADVAFVQALHGLEDLLQLPSAPPPIQASRDSRPTSEPERRRSESPRPAVPAPPPPQPPDRTGEAPSAPTEAIKPQP
jgi:hypothetical protein